jgi:conjugal transfer/entry exclusion protein
MRIREWFTKLRKREDAAAIARAEERVSGDSRAERETWSGDMQGLTADNRAARRVAGGTQGDLDRLSE